MPTTLTGVVGRRAAAGCNQTRGDASADRVGVQRRSVADTVALGSSAPSVCRLLQAQALACVAGSHCSDDARRENRGIMRFRAGVQDFRLLVHLCAPIQPLIVENSRA